MITVCSVTGVNPIGHMEAIERTQRAIPHYTKHLFKFIPGLTLDGYSKFIVKKLHELIETEFVLICQPDGYGRHIEHWTDDFLDYDYIGAPFPCGQVGNGGLSLRSSRFLCESARRGPPDIAEDAYLCQYERASMEQAGLTFAPVDLALRFSFEHFSFEHPVEGRPWFPQDSWGFHGHWHL